MVGPGFVSEVIVKPQPVVMPPYSVEEPSGVASGRDSITRLVTEPPQSSSRLLLKEVRGMGLSAPRARAAHLNPRTPARPDLKSGAVVLAWLPPRDAHRVVG